MQSIPDTKEIPELTELIHGLVQLAMNARIEAATLRHFLVSNGGVIDPDQFEAARRLEAQAALAEYGGDSYFDRVVRKAMQISESSGTSDRVT